MMLSTGVSSIPAEKSPTRTPFPESSSASPFENAPTAALVAEYTPVDGNGTYLRSEPTLRN